MKTLVKLAGLLLLIIPINSTHAEVLTLEKRLSGKKTRTDLLSEKSPKKKEIAYEVTIDPDNTKLAHVKMTFIPEQPVLYMTQGANQLPNRWATFVHDIRANSTNGKQISLQKLPDARWKIQSTSKEKIVVHYTLRLDHEDHKWSGGIDGAAYATEWGVFYTGRSLFVLNGEEWDRITVKYNLPESWSITTPWKSLDEAPHSFEVTNLTALMQSMFFAGKHEEVSLIRDDFELVFALGGEDIIAQKDDFKSMAQGVLDYYIELMGGVPNPSPNNKFKKSIVIINSSTMTDGEQIGNNISMLIEKDGNPMSQMISRFMFAHEFFHLWNGKSFWPTENDCEWFKEGFTNYYTLKSLYHIGFINDASYLEVLNSLFFQRYASDDGVGKLSMTLGDEKHDHWGLIYSGGLFVAMAQDMIIRNATRNTKSVDDLMRGLFQKYGGTTSGYSLDELEKSLSELSGKEQSEFFNTYVKGTEEIPIDTYLSMAGFIAKIDGNTLIIENESSLDKRQVGMQKGFFGALDTEK